MRDAVAIGIEIGGTKIQAGVGARGAPLSGLARAEVDPERGAEGIRAALPELVRQALARAGAAAADAVCMGIGFGGPVDARRGVAIRSHQINGWEDFPLQDWAEERWGLPVRVRNDADTAGLAEAVQGAGVGCGRIFYITIGSGIGGGLITDGAIDEGQGRGAAEIGHTWVPDFESGLPAKLESLCSGWAIGRRSPWRTQSHGRSPSRQSTRVRSRAPCKPPSLSAIAWATIRWSMIVSQSFSSLPKPP